MQRFSIIIIIFMAYVVFSGVGLVDDGGFYDSLNSNGMYILDGTTFISNEMGDTVKTTSYLPIPIAKLINSFNAEEVLGQKVFDIRSLSIIYLVIVAIGVYLMSKAIATGNKLIDIGIFSIFCLMICDKGYLLYFNTLYSNPLLISGILLCMGAWLNVAVFDKHRNIMSAISAFGAILVALCGVQYIIIALIFMIAHLLLFCVPSSKFLQNTAPVMCGVLIGVVCIVVYLGYDVVPNPNEVEASYECVEKSGEHVEGYGHILVAYMRNPTKLIENLSTLSSNSPFLYPTYLKPDSPFLGIGIWEWIRKMLVPSHIVFYVIFFAATISVAVKELRNSRMGIVVLALASVCIEQLFAVILLYGVFSPSKNLMLFNLCFDILFIIAIAWSAVVLTARREKIKEKFGVNQ